MTTPAWEAFEKRVAEALGAELVPQSGAGKWAKLDVRGATLLVSCKHTDKASRSFQRHEMDEAERAARGPGGPKGDILPALAFGIQDDEPVIIMRASDFAELVINREPITVQESSKSAGRRMATHDTPLMRHMRDEMGD